MGQKPNGRVVQIHLETEIKQEGEISRHEFDMEGKATQMGEVLYLNYQEAIEAQEETPVVIKLMPEGAQITRFSANKLILKFQMEELITTAYQTPYGKIPMTTKTLCFEQNWNSETFQGELVLDYQLLTAGQVVGDYKLRLLFNP